MKKFLCFCVLVLTLFSTFGCRTEEVTFYERVNHRFDSMNVIENIKDNVALDDIFERGLPSDKVEFEGELWTVDDHLLIAESIHQLSWGESMNGWFIKSVTFRYSCEQIGQKRLPFSSTIEFLKVDASRYRSEIGVISTGTASIEREVFHPNLKNLIGMGSVNTNLVNDLINEVETNGGENIRNDTNNSCQVAIKYPNSSQNNVDFLSWQISYETFDEFGNSEDFIKFFLAPKTGE